MRKITVIEKAKATNVTKTTDLAKQGAQVPATTDAQYKIIVDGVVLTAENATFRKKKGRLVVEKDGEVVVELDYGSDFEAIPAEPQVADGWASLSTEPTEAGFVAIPALLMGSLGAAGAAAVVDSSLDDDTNTSSIPGPTIGALGDPDGDGKINANGTADAGSTITVTWPDGTTSTTTANTDGTWSVESATVQTSGTVKATGKNVDGSTTATTTTTYTDTTPPGTPTVKLADSDGDGKINASGTAEPGSTVTVTWPDRTTSTATAGADGTWSVESATVQTGGSVSVTAKDAAGGTSVAATTTYTDTTPPATPTVSVADTDADGKINANGTAESGSIITITWPDSTTSTATTGADGTWSVESATVQSGGPVRAIARDAAGNSSSTALATYGDTTPTPAPTVTVTDSDGDDKINASGTAEPGSTITVTWPDSTTSTAITAADGTWSVESTTVQGSGPVSATAKDGANNVSTPTVVAYADATLPAAPTVTVADSDSDGKINASGTAEPGSTITVTWPDSTTSTATTNASGNWSVESTTVQTSGSVSAIARDAAGNASAAGSTTYTDSILPAAPTVTVGDTDGDGKINASGTAEAGSTITVTWPNRTTSTATTDASGNWNVESPTVQTSGSVKATARDAAGNTSTATTTPYTDSTPPAAPTVGVGDSDGDNKINASGTAEPGSTITVTWPDRSTSTATTDASGNWSVESTTDQTSGPVSVIARDAAGNNSTPANVNYTVGSTPPAPPTVTVADTDADGKINASGTAKAGSTVTVIWPDGTTGIATTDANGNWSVESTAVQGSGQVSATARDTTGNTSNPTAVTYTDTTPPTLPTITVVDSDRDGRIDASGIAEPGSIVTVTWPDNTTSTATTDARGNWSVESPTVQSSGAVSATARDAANNASAAATATYTDSNPPSAPTVVVADTDADGKINASGIAKAGSIVTVTWPDGTTSTATSTAGGTWSVESPTVQGSGSVSATAREGANISAPTLVSYTDSTPPSAPTISVADTDADGKINASGSAEPGSIVTVTWPDHTTSTATTNASGTWSVESPTTQGSGSVSATAKDAANNASTPTSVNYNAGSGVSAVAITAISDDTGTAGDFTTKDTSLTVSGTYTGTLAGGEKIEVHNGTSWVGVTSQGSGTWTYVDQATHNTNFTYQVRVVDQGGVVGVTNTKAITIDTTAPVVTVAITAISEDTGNPGDFITSDTSLTVSGTLSGTLAAGDKIQVSNGGAWHDIIPTPTGTTWSYVDTDTHTNGTFTYQVRVVDNADNVGAIDDQLVNVNGAPPSPGVSVVAITAISDDSGTGTPTDPTRHDFITNDTSLTVSGSYTGTLGTGEHIQVSFDGTNWADASTSATPTGGTWSYVDGTTHTSNFTYQVRHVSQAGVAGVTDTQAITIDTTAPAVTVAVTGISDDTGNGVPATLNDFITNDTSLTVNGTYTGTLATGDTIQVSSNGGTSWANATASGGTWSYVDGGAHTSNFTYQVRVVDNADNATTPISKGITIDTTAPDGVTKVDITAIVDDTGEADFTTSDSTLFVNGTYAGTLATDDRIQVSSNGTTWNNATTTGPTTWTYDDTANPHSGPFTYQVRVVDIAGNVGVTDSQEVNVTTGPGVKMTSSLDNVTNLDVTSNLVLTAGENVTAVAGKHIRIVNDGGTGFHGENTAHTQDILVDSSMVTISGNKVIINPGFDLDLGNTYHITVEAGAFVGVSSGLSSDAITDPTAINFTTVTPGSTAIGNAAASQMVQADGTLAAGRSWLDLEGIGGLSQANATPLDLSGGNYAVVFKDYDIRGGSNTSFYDGIGVGNAFPRLNGFGPGDLLYIDDQGNDPAKANLLSQSSFDGNGSTTTPINIRFDGTDSGGPGNAGEGAIVEVVFATGISPIAGNDINLETMRLALGISTNPILSA